MAKSRPITFGKTDEMIFQIIHRAAIPLSTNDVYQRLHSEGVFHEIPAQRARTDIGAKLRKLKSRGVISRVDPVKGTQLWQLDPDTRAKLPRITEPTPTATEPKPAAAKTKSKTKSTQPADVAMVRVDMPTDRALIWADVLNDLSYYQFLRPELVDMFSAIESAIRHALPQAKEAA